jgi:hypothetical protein
MWLLAWAMGKPPLNFAVKQNANENLLVQPYLYVLEENLS